MSRKVKYTTQRGKGGIYYMDFRYNGHYYRDSLRTADPDEAEYLVDKQRTELRQIKLGLINPKKKLKEILFPVACEEYLAEYKEIRKPKSYDRYSVAYRALLPSFRRKKLSEITYNDLAQHRRKRHSAGKSTATCNHEMRFMRAMLNWGIQKEYVDNNVAAKNKLVEKEPKKRFHCLTEAEEIKLRAVCPPQLLHVVIVALHTGLRANECRNLVWQMIDFKEKTIIVDFEGGSKNSDTDSIGMTDEVLEVLQKLKRNRKPKPSDNVFLSRNKTPYVDWRSAFTKAVERAGIGKFYFHDLRRTFITRLIKNKNNTIADVQKAARHKSLEMTMRYVHLARNSHHEAVRRTFNKPEIVTQPKRRRMTL